MLNQAAKEHCHVAVGHISFNFKITAVTPEVLTVQGAVKLLNMGFFQRATSLLDLVETQKRCRTIGFASLRNCGVQLFSHCVSVVLRYASASGTLKLARYLDGNQNRKIKNALTFSMNFNRTNLIRLW